jgi:hypothetical protein
MISNLYVTDTTQITESPNARLTENQDSNMLDGAAQETTAQTQVKTTLTTTPGILCATPETEMAIPPGVTTMPPGVASATTPAVTPTDTTTSAGASETYATYEDTHKEMSEFASLLILKAADNESALRNALSTAPEEVKEALLEAIEISEAGYENALNAVIE